MLNTNYVQTAFESALETLLWSETDDDGNPFGDEYSEFDITGELSTFHQQLRAFIQSNAEDLEGISATSCGYDFVLTRNGHGAGFWDRGYGELGDRLTASCKPYGKCSLYVGDDGLLYLSA